MSKYHYCLIRYIPDPRRMEPLNVGVILQSETKIDVRFSPHAAKRKDVDTKIYQSWRHLFEAEIRGPQTPLFQPDKRDIRFLKHLASLTAENLSLTDPLRAFTEATSDFDRLLGDLFDELVVPPSSPAQADESRPTGIFRRKAEAHRFLARGMRRHAHITVNEKRLWMAYRQYVNGQTIAIDKVEVANQIGGTSNEIERLPHIVHLLPAFFDGSSSRRARYYLIADHLKQPFTDQSETEFKAMQDDLESHVHEITRRGGIVLREPSEVTPLIEELNEQLPSDLISA